MLVLDASIVVGSYFEHEPHHKRAKDFFDKLVASQEGVIVPETFVLEVASAIARGTGLAQEAESFSNELFNLPSFTFLELNREFILQARSIAIHNRLRALDSCYLAAARQYGLTLYTLDREQLKKAPPDIKVKLI